MDRPVVGADDGLAEPGLPFACAHTIVHTRAAAAAGDGGTGCCCCYGVHNGVCARKRKKWLGELIVWAYDRTVH